MKKIVIALFSMFLSIGAYAQTSIDFGKFQTSFKDFAGSIASSLPANSTIGLNWSDAYIGYLPHFGIGLSAGFTTIPGAAVDTLTQNLGLGSLTTALGSSAANLINQYGVPLPGYTVDLRLGGLFLPFDVGLKFGYIGDKISQIQQALPAGMQLNYLLTGIDVRFQLVKEGFLIPEISVGGGFNYLSGNVGFKVGSGDITLANFSVPDPSTNYTTNTTYNITLTQPDLVFAWDSKVFDAKIQVSKHILIFTPYVGLGASYGISSAGGGLSSTLLINGSTPTPAEISAIQQGLKYLNNGQTFDFTSQGILAYAAANGFGARFFGGMSIDLLILHLDLNAMYDFVGKSYGAGLNFRIQF
ncbi:MAG TPA: hypothetical protein VMW73_06650 [Spirochaetia bacterium]|nr:hypothetical protein [Spirochaetia bacterium]